MMQVGVVKITPTFLKRLYCGAPQYMVKFLMKNQQKERY